MSTGDRATDQILADLADKFRQDMTAAAKRYFDLTQALGVSDGDAAPEMLSEFADYLVALVAHNSTIPSKVFADVLAQGVDRRRAAKAAGKAPPIVP